MQELWTEKKFSSLPFKQQHKKASELLRRIYQGEPSLWPAYQQLCRWIGIACAEAPSPQLLSDRFHEHLQGAGISWQEHNLLITQSDKPSNTPFYPISIYLDNLRSAFNVGSILRTTEAFRLGTILFSPSTPYIDNAKVQKTSMKTWDKVPCRKALSIDDLPRPIIGLETCDTACHPSDYIFPKSFTLALGNEEYGLSAQVLSQLDTIISIPLVGSKNSLNVASAFAICASCIRRQMG